MNYFLLYRSLYHANYCLVSKDPLSRTKWASTPLDILSNITFMFEWKLLGSPTLETSFKDQDYQVIASFDSLPTLDYIKTNYPEILL